MEGRRGLQGGIAGVEVDGGGVLLRTLSMLQSMRGRVGDTGRFARRWGASSGAPGSKGGVGWPELPRMFVGDREVVASNTGSLGAPVVWGLGGNGEGKQALK